MSTTTSGWEQLSETLFGWLYPSYFPLPSMTVLSHFPKPSLTWKCSQRSCPWPSTAGSITTPPRLQLSSIWGYVTSLSLALICNYLLDISPWILSSSHILSSCCSAGWQHYHPPKHTRSGCLLKSTAVATQRPRLVHILGFLFSFVWAATKIEQSCWLWLNTAWWTRGWKTSSRAQSEPAQGDWLSLEAPDQSEQQSNTGRAGDLGQYVMASLTQPLFSSRAGISSILMTTQRPGHLDHDLKWRTTSWEPHSSQ